MEDLILVDLSYLIHQSKYAFRMLSIPVNENGVLSERPTGHVFGVLKAVLACAQSAKTVFLCVDSKSTRRRALLAQYKKDRPHEGYNVFQDLADILALACSLANVYYVQVPELEADDLISSYIQQGATYGVFPAVYGNDNDLLQTDALFKRFNSFKNGYQPDYQDVPAYLESKFGYRLNFLPVWEKVLRGDVSDRVPKACPRFKSEKVIKAVLDNQTHQDIDRFLGYCRDTFPELYVKYPEFEQQCRINYQIVLPDYRDIREFRFQKPQPRPGETVESAVAGLVEKYRLYSLTSTLVKRGQF